ncbi:MAG: hypothetical protein AUH81_18465 [Candidatus Rokubacteria bacterium 13_1_40CM_4_69_5]|nr:MAG: hypothetical protein AUH81_18465 [Candidatus Rokubacteria bacterium 13_1_40CM_4_69_5]
MDDDLIAGQDLLQRLQRGEVAAGHDAHAHRHAAQIAEPRARGSRPHVDAKARHAVHVGHELAHAGPGVADASPVTRGVGDQGALDEGRVLGPGLVGVAPVPAHAVHDVVEQLGLEPLGLEVAFLQRDPLLEPHEMWNDLDPRAFGLTCHGVPS